MTQALVLDPAHYVTAPPPGTVAAFRLEMRVRGLVAGGTPQQLLRAESSFVVSMASDLRQIDFGGFRSGDGGNSLLLHDPEFDTLSLRDEHLLRLQFNPTGPQYSVEAWALDGSDHRQATCVAGAGAFAITDFIALGNTGFNSNPLSGVIDWARIFTTNLPLGSAAPDSLTVPGSAALDDWELDGTLVNTGSRGTGANLVWNGGGSPTFTTQPDLPSVAPTISSATYASGAVTLAFTDPNAGAQNETAVDIERRIGSTGDWLRLGYVGADVTGYVDSRVAHGVAYQYRVKARNHFGSSAYSAIASVTTGAGTNTNPTVTENAKTGTAAWTLTNPASEREIEGYCDVPSINRGGTINLKVNSLAGENFNLEVFRIGWYGGLMARRIRNITNVTGTAQTMPTAVGSGPRYQYTCQWTTSYALSLTDADPTEWPSGHYVVRCTQVTSGKQVYLHFIVRDDTRPAAHLVNCPTNTYHAYSAWPNKLSDTGRTLSGRGWYNISRNGGNAEASYNRPYQVLPRAEAAYGTGAGELLALTAPGNTYADHAERTVSSEASWVRWLEKNGHDVKYCCDLDLHVSGATIWSNVSSILFPGHQEYWSYEMRQTVKAARDYGVHLAFLGANASYWPVRFENDPISGQVNRCMVGYKDPAENGADPLSATDIRRGTDKVWRIRGTATDEAAFVGVQYEGDPAGDATMQFTAAAGTDPLGTGAGLGASSTAPGAVGYEWDRTYPLSPAGIVVLAHSTFPPGTGHSGGLTTGTSDMTVYRVASGAEVFATGSMQAIWAADDYKVPTLRPDYAHAGLATLLTNAINRQGTPSIAEAGTGGGGGGGGTGRRPLRRFGFRTRRV